MIPAAELRNYIQRRKAGFDPVDAVDQAIQNNQEAQAAKVQAVARQLEIRREQAYAMIQKLTDRVESIDHLGSSEAQCEALRKTLQNLKQVEKEWESHFKQTENKLQTLKAHRLELTEKMDKMEHSLRQNPPPGSLERSLYEGGDKLSSAISQHIRAAI
jgi:chromosome segregation ATPase